MVKGIDKKYIEEVRKLKEGRKPPGISIKSIIKREITKASIGQLITLPILIGLLVFFLKAESISTILLILGVAITIAIILYPFLQVPIKDEDDVTEPGSSMWVVVIAENVMKSDNTP